MRLGQTLQALRMRRKPKPSAWAESSIYINGGARPGKLRHINAPYLSGLMDIIDAPGVQSVHIKKAAQIGVSAMVRWLIAFWAIFEGDATGLAFPDEKKGTSSVRKYVLPLFRRNKDLQTLHTTMKNDLNQNSITLSNGFVLQLMWASSASSTSSDPLRNAVCDETDKFESWTGDEPHGVHRMASRVKTYEHRGRKVNISTPTSRSGMISQLERNAAIRLRFVAPCPHCETRVQLLWSQVQFKHYEDKPPHVEWARRVGSDPANAWYECQSCGGTWTDTQRKVAVQSGWYGTVDDSGIADGEIKEAEAIEEWPPFTEIGIQIGGLYLMWASLVVLASSYIKAIGSRDAGDPLPLVSFFQEDLGECMEQEVAHQDEDAFEAMEDAAPLDEGVVPVWADKLIATVDTQKDHFWLVIRAWGPQRRSARVFHGKVDYFEDLDRWCFEHAWPVEGGQFSPMTCSIMLIDAGGTKHVGSMKSRTQEVYGYAMDRPGLVRAVRGSPKPKDQLYWRGEGVYDPGDGRAAKRKLPLYHLDVHGLQDILAEMITGEVTVISDDGEPITVPRWELNRRPDREYRHHMSNLVKVASPRAGGLAEVWEPVTGAARVDYRDCEGYQVAAAYMVGIDKLPSQVEYLRWKRTELKKQIERQQRKPSTGHRGRNGGSWITQR